MLILLNFAVIMTLWHQAYAVDQSPIVTSDGSVGYGEGKFLSPKEPVDFRGSAYNSQSFKHYKVIRVIPRNTLQLAFLNQLEGPILETNDKEQQFQREGNLYAEMKFWKAPTKVNIPVDIMISPSGYKMLQNILTMKGIPYILLNNDVGKDIDNENRYHPATAYSTSTGFDYGRYHQYHEIINEMKSLISRYSSIAKLVDFGRSYKGYKMEGIKISSGYAIGKKTFFFNCGIHAREWVTPATCIYLVEQMLRNYGNDRDITQMITKMDWVILPVLNVDGYMYTWSHRNNRLWRKTRSGSGSGNCVGVDPNRNFGFKWGGLGSSSDPCKDTYRGKKAFSEVEVKNVARYLYNNRHNLAGYADIHSYGQYWMFPWGFTKQYTKDYAEQNRVASAAVAAIKKMPSRRTYRDGPSAIVIYPAAGGSDDWTYGVLKVKYSFTVELRDTGRYGFLLPADQIIPAAREALEGLKATSKTMIV